MRYTIVFRKPARKEYEKLPKEARSIIDKKLALLSGNPYQQNNNVKALTGEDKLYRLRVGDYRVVYTLDDGALIIEIIRVKHRKEVYL